MRVAIGDLLIDVDVSDAWDVEYSLNGSLLAESDEGEFELSALTFAPRPGAAPPSLLNPAEGAVTAVRPGVTLQRRDETTTLVGFTGAPPLARLLVATHAPEAAAEVAEIMTSVGPAHDPFGPPGEHVQSCPVRDSHGPWFAQRRRSLLDAIGWRASMPKAAQRLDDFWAELVQSPPSDEAQRDTMISCAAVGFGDLLAPLGFSWCVVCDEWGTQLGMMALPETARVVVVPASFVDKRWESQQPRFIEHGLEAIAASLARVRADWKPN